MLLESNPAEVKKFNTQRRRPNFHYENYKFGQRRSKDDMEKLKVDKAKNIENFAAKYGCLEKENFR